MHKKIIAMALTSLFAVASFFSLNQKTYATNAFNSVDERVFGYQDENGIWQKDAYDEVSIDDAALISNKDYFRGILSGSSQVESQGIYRVAPKQNSVGINGYIALELRSHNETAKLEDLGFAYRISDAEGVRTISSSQWSDGTDTPMPELTKQWQTYYLHTATMFPFTGIEGNPRFVGITLNAIKGSSGYVDINHVYYCDNIGDAYYDEGVYKIDNFTRDSLTDNSGQNFYWAGGNGEMFDANYYVLSSKTLRLVSKTYGNMDGKYGSLSFEVKWGDITDFTPIYINETNDGFVNGATKKWLEGELYDSKGNQLQKINQMGADKGFITIDINFANSGIKSEGLVGFELKSGSTYLKNFRFVNDEVSDATNFANAILTKTQPYCDLNNPEAIKGIESSWSEIKTQYENMSTTSREYFVENPENDSEISEAMARYQIIVKKYVGNYGIDDFMSVVNNSNIINFKTNEYLFTIIAIIAIASVSLILGMYFIKRKQFR